MAISIESDRWNQIAGLVDEKGRVSVEEIVNILNVSPATARRDLRKMHRLGLISRTRGGAAPAVQAAFDPGLAECLQVYMPEKEAIARYAAQLIEPGDTVILDGGSTTHQVALNIEAANVIVVTNAYSIISALMSKKNVEVVMVGGLLSHHSGVAVGPDAVKMFQQLRADKAIVGTNGISASDGITSPNRLVAETKQAIVEHCIEVIVVADHTKVGESLLFNIAPIDAVDKLITDNGANEEQLQELRDAGVEVIVAPVAGRRTDPCSN